MILLDFCNEIMDDRWDKDSADFLYNGAIYFFQANLKNRYDKNQMVTCWKEVECERSDYNGLYNKKEFFIKASKNVIPVDIFTEHGKIKAVMRVPDRRIIWYKGKWYL